MSDPAALAAIARALAFQQAAPALDAETLVLAREEAMQRQARTARLLDHFDATGRLLAVTFAPSLALAA
jgi:hypothetical protein